MDDKQMDALIATILRLGVSLAAILVLLGGVMYLRQAGMMPPNYKIFHPAIFHYEFPPSTGRSVTELGLLLLILTPVARVVFSVFAFAKEKDWTYVTITLIVLVLLGVGWLTGQAA
jgi:uncharacterized membrane protein